MGAFVALNAGVYDRRVSALLAVAARLMDMYDLSDVTRSTKPKFLIHGEADELIPLKDMWRFYGALQEPKELVVIDSANHIFDGHVSEVGDAVEDLLKDFSATELESRARTTL